MSIYSAVVIVCTQGKSCLFFHIKFDNADYGKEILFIQIVG